MLLLVLVVIASVPTQAIIHNITINQTSHDVKREDTNSSQESIGSSNRSKYMKSHRNCTSNDQNCIPICCEPVSHDRSVCYASVTSSLVEDIDFSANRACNLSALGMSPEELIVSREKKYALDADSPHDLAFYLLGNGTIYETNFVNGDQKHWLDLDDYYCLAPGISENGEKSIQAVCFPTVEENTLPTDLNIIYVVSTVLSLPFLAVTYLAYALLPKFNNMHGSVLRAYVGSLFVMFVSLIIPNFAKQQLCSKLVFITYFTSVACFSWVNVMSFDIWWTFRRCLSVQPGKRQSDRKKYIIYSIFAWGSALILAAICATIDNVPNIPGNFIKPGLGRKACCVFASFAARGVYFFLPTGISVICNVYLFVASIKNISHQKKNIAHHLEGTGSRCHNENKERFNFAVKLCTMMVINWLMEIINCMCERTSLQYFWAIMDLMNVLQGITIFIIFVWTDEMKLQLMKYLGFADRDIEKKPQAEKGEIGNGDGNKTKGGVS